MQISPKYPSSLWRSLKLDDPNSPDWPMAIEIFKDRIVGRFLDPIDKLVGTESDLASERSYGFVVMAIDCLLVETIGAFYEGLLDTLGKSRETIVDFLMTNPHFSSDFHSKDQVENFYYDFRCGILHQAEIGRKSRVWSISKLVEFYPDGMTVNRTKFHLQIKGAIYDYNG